MNQYENSLADRLIDVASGVESRTVVTEDRRLQDRVEYGAFVAMMTVDDGGERSSPVVLRARDISLGGLSVSCRRPLEPGANGVVQLVRSDGRTALVGVRVRHCQYHDENEHVVGLAFNPLPEPLTIESFLDDDGRLRLFDSLLGENRST